MRLGQQWMGSSWSIFLPLLPQGRRKHDNLGHFFHSVAFLLQFLSLRVFFSTIYITEVFHVTIFPLPQGRRRHENLGHSFQIQYCIFCNFFHSGFIFSIIYITKVFPVAISLLPQGRRRHGGVGGRAEGGAARHLRGGVEPGQLWGDGRTPQGLPGAGPGGEGLCLPLPSQGTHTLHLLLPG